MFIAGWGDNNKFIAFLGLEKCGNCNNCSFFNLYEHSKKISLYFVPVAKYSKSYIAVCETCNAAYEYNDKEYEAAIKDSLNIPDKELIGAIWNDLDAKIVEDLVTNKKQPKDIAKYIKTLKKDLILLWSSKTEESTVEYVFDRYISSTSIKNN